MNYLFKFLIVDPVSLWASSSNTGLLFLDRNAIFEYWQHKHWIRHNHFQPKSKGPKFIPLSLSLADHCSLSKTKAKSPKCPHRRSGCPPPLTTSITWGSTTHSPPRRPKTSSPLSPSPPPLSQYTLGSSLPSARRNQHPTTTVVEPRSRAKRKMCGAWTTSSLRWRKREGEARRGEAKGGL